jgi:transcriptional regulator with XRE-family HTH domain
VSLSSKLKELRKERDLSQEELAKRSGIDRSTIAYLETDRTDKPSAETFFKLAFALDIHVNELFAAAGYIKDPRGDYYNDPTIEQLLDKLKLTVSQLEKKLKEKKEQQL